MSIRITADRVSSTGTPVRLVAIGMIAIAVALLGFDTPREIAPGGSVPAGDLAVALPVPENGKVLLRRIDFETGHSLMVVDLEDADPADAFDTVAFLRLEPFTGILMARATRPLNLPSFEDPAAWWCFPHHDGVRVSTHATTRAASIARLEELGSGNPSHPGRAGSAIEEVDVRSTAEFP